MRVCVFFVFMFFNLQPNRAESNEKQFCFLFLLEAKNNIAASFFTFIFLCICANSANDSGTKRLCLHGGCLLRFGLTRKLSLFHCHTKVRELSLGILLGNLQSALVYLK